MPGIIDWINKYSHWLVLLFLEGISLVLLISFNGYQGSVWFSGANSAAGIVQQWQQEALAYLHLGSVNKELTDRNIELERELEVLRNELHELTHDSTYTERALAAKLAQLPVLPACVVGNSIAMRDNYVIIDKGAGDGVSPKMGVVCGTGVVGIVSQVTDHYAVVMSVLNGKSSISCRLRGSNYFGYLHWQGGNLLCATLDDVPRHAVVKVGDAVETSGFSNVFPPGIFVGRVIKVRDSKDGLSYQLVVHLSSDLANIRDVAVILNNDDTDIIP
ncbi:MAG: rod shape-determining protein MreC [Bacteroidaceae bacterium]|nr:rod shape-determining protein MreC [Bacteroidaceae bacterium]